VSTEILVVGLPNAGKTTFLAALWHVLHSEEIPGALRLSSLSGDAEYLNSIKDEWIQYAPVTRTSQQAERMTQINLTDSSSKSQCELVIPDLSGETYRHQWTERVWTEAFEKLASGASALMVFRHPEQMIEPIEIAEAKKLLPDEESEDREGESGTGLETSVQPVWEPERAASVVQLVDVLQFISDNLRRKFRVSVIVSAWDLLKDTKYKTPEQYVEAKVSFLQQFLESNPELFDFKIYGVSAIGCSLDDKDAKLDLQKKTTPSERIEVVTADSSTHDITAPLKWALEW
jgi:GTPase SAR1 family protein